MKTLLSHVQLLKAKRLLYMTHMAIGDYVYQRMFLKKLKESYPNLQIDLWFDDCLTEVDNWNAQRGKTLSEWFQNEPFLHNLYPVASSAKAREKLIEKAGFENYDIIVFCVAVNSERYAQTARSISKKAYIVGSLIKPYKSMVKKWHVFKECDDFYWERETSSAPSVHITKFYQKQFLRVFGLLTTDEEIKPRMQVPEIWQNKMNAWLKEIKRSHQAIKGTIFINYLSTQEKRNWKLSQAIDLIVLFNHLEADWTYIINVPPNVLPEIQQIISREPRLKNIHVVPFSAKEHFYELPALIQLSDCVISVETAVIHLASALSVPQIALVRYKAKNWAPLKDEKSKVIFTRKLPTRIYHITVEEVFERYKNFKLCGYS